MTPDPPLALEFVALASFFAENVKKLPPELQPAAVAALEAAILGESAAVLTAVAALPDLPRDDDRGVVKAQADKLLELLKDHFSESAVREASAFVHRIDRTVNPATGPAPVVPHATTAALVNEQTRLLIRQLLKDLL